MICRIYFINGQTTNKMDNKTKRFHWTIFSCRWWSSSFFWRRALAQGSTSNINLPWFFNQLFLISDDFKYAILNNWYTFDSLCRRHVSSVTINEMSDKFLQRNDLCWCFGLLYLRMRHWSRDLNHSEWRLLTPLFSSCRFVIFCKCNKGNNFQ